MLKNHVFGSFNLNNSEKYRLSFEDIFLGTLDTYTTNEPTLNIFFGGVHGKVCLLIAYKLICLYREKFMTFRTIPHVQVFVCQIINICYYLLPIAAKQIRVFHNL